MSELTEPATIHNGLALYRRGLGYPLLALAYPHASGGGPRRRLSAPGKPSPPGGPDYGVPGSSPRLAVAECLDPVTGG
jgi:hypothetical protein